MIRVILFDLGGVLVDWDGVGPLVELTGGRLSPEEARRFWFESPWVSRFEKGKCTPGEFASGVVAELGLSVSPETFIEDFKSWDRGLYPGVPEMLDALRGDYILACITNNNRVYTESLIERYELDRKFHHFFVSYQTGLTKPSSEAFENVLREIGVPPSEVVYFDDNAECVESAARSGIRAYKVSGMGQLRERMNFLREKGILGTVS